MKHLLLILLFFISISSKAQDTIMPTIGEIYNYDIGDVFEYKYLTYNYQGTSGLMVREYTIKTVLDKWFLNDRVHYVFKELKERYYQYPPSSGTSYSLDTIENYFEPLDSSIFYSFNEHDTTTSSPCNYCHIDSVYTSSEFHGRKLVHHYQGDFMSNGYIVFGEGLGMIKSHFMSEDQGTGQGGDELIYYRKNNGETWGSLYGIQYVGLSEADYPFASLYGNNSGHFAFTLSQQPNSNTKLQLYNLTGQLTGTYVISSSVTNLDLGMLPKGIYLWQLEQDGKTIQNGKLITQ